MRHIDVITKEVRAGDILAFLTEGFAVRFIDANCYLDAPDTEGIIEGGDPFGNVTFIEKLDLISAAASIRWASSWIDSGKDTISPINSTLSGRLAERYFAV